MRKETGSTLARHPALHLALIAILGGLVYSNTFESPFVLDDYRNIVEAPYIRGFEFLKEFKSVHFRHLAKLTFALNYHFGGLGVTGYHAVNTAIHILASLLVYWLAALLLRTPYFMREAPRAGGSLIPLFCALLFAVHPVETQAVTYITQRYASLAALFYILSVALYVRSRLPGGGAGRRFFYGGSLASAVLAILTKESAVTLPAAVGLAELMFFTGRPWTRIRPLLPFLIPMIAAPVTIAAVGLDPFKMGHPPHTRWEYLLTQFGVVIHYIRLMFWPAGQNFDYDWPVTRSLTDPAAYLNLAALLIIFAAAVYLLLRSRSGDVRLRLASFGIIWFFVTISVVSSVIVIDDLIFEHRMYLPSAGFFMAAAALASLGADRLGKLVPAAGKISIAAAAAVVIALSIAAHSRNEVWKSAVSLFEDNVRKSPDKARTRNSLGVAYLEAGRLDEAIEQFKISADLNPKYIRPRLNLGLVWQMKGDKGKAIMAYRAALALNPASVKTHNNLGVLYAEQGDLAAAERQFRLALSIRPDDERARNNLGVNFERQGLYEAAEEEFSRAVRINPLNAESRYNLATAYLKLGRLEEAVGEFKTALSLKPDDADILCNLGYTYTQQGLYSEAVKVLEQAIAINPGHKDALENLRDAKEKLARQG